jgi:arylsulfatase A-like enzyme
MTDFYDDAILNFDHQTEKIVEYLKENGEFDNTLLVIYSDHGQHWTITDKLPLIIHIPEDAYQGILTANTQNVDIAPTILDYMQISDSIMDGRQFSDTTAGSCSTHCCTTA